jgi:large subunit ribosomal protein LP2
MRNIAAYLLLQAGGKENPSAADIRKLLGVVGIETDDDRLDHLISELSGKSINDVSISYGSLKT